MKKKLILLLILTLVAAAVFAQLSDPSFYADDVYIGTAVDYGLGGPYPTDNDGLETIFANPAGFRSAEEDFTFMNMTTTVTGPVFDIAELVQNALADDVELTSLLSDEAVQSMLSSLYLGFEQTGPIYFGYVGDGFGFGLFNSTDVLIEGTGPISLAATVSEEVLLAGGYSFRIPLTENEKHAIDIGVMLKGGVEGEVAIEKSFIELAGMFDDISADIILDAPFEFTSFIGVDAGIQYIWEDMLSIGVAFQDCYSPAVRYTYDGGISDFIDSTTDAPDPELGLIPFKMNAGFELNPTIPVINTFITDFRLMAAYDDIFDFYFYPSEAENWLLHIKAGTQLTLLEILELRAGVDEGLLNAGFGLDLKIFKINAAMFGTERSSQPNTSPVFNMALAINF